jgi:hypothetical protein
MEMETNKTKEEKRIFDKYIGYINDTKKINDWVVQMFNSEIEMFKRTFPSLIILFLSSMMFFFSCSSIESRIKENNYTDYWYYHNNKRYQVYKTDRDKYYIVVLNKKETRFVRKHVLKPTS